jgi:Asp-tRNA(Asn)/Glu-tRNA(Gln) amidotransferase C subunit
MKYENDAKKILDEFSKKLEEIPKSSEVFYNTNETNAFRPDCKPVDKRLYDKVMKIAPNKDKKGFINVERTKL